MKNKLRFLSMLVIVLFMACIMPTSFGAKEMNINKKLNLKYSDGVLTWSKIYGPDYNDVYYEVSIRLNNLEYSDEHCTSQSVNVKEIFDAKGKATGTYKAQVIARSNGNSIITSESVDITYISSQEKLEAPSNLRWDGKIARWNASPNATNYRILLLSARGGNVVTYTTSDLEYNFTNTSGYAVEEGCYFTVTAMADGYRNSNANESPTYKQTATEEPVTTETKTNTITVKMLDNDSKNENIGGEISLTTGAYNGQNMFKNNEIREDFPEGLPITLVARPETGFRFVCWQKDYVTLTTETTYQFDSHAQDETYIAVFEKETEVSNKEEYTIRVKIYDDDSKKENVGGQISVSSGTYNGQNFFRSEEIVNDYEKGIAMTLVARAGEGYKFIGWKTENSVITTERVYQFTTSTKDETYTAVFAKESTSIPTEQPIETPIEQEKEKPWEKASEWAEPELEKANTLNVIPEIFSKQDLTQNITRKEFAHVAVKLYEKLTGSKAIAIANNPFTDTKDSEVLKAYNVGITNGTSDVTFNPDDLITREQMATMMTRALTKAGIDTKVDLEKVSKFADDSEMHDWGKTSIYYMSNIGIIKGMGENQFGVLGNATREQALLISERSAEKFAK